VLHLEYADRRESPAADDTKQQPMELNWTMCVGFKFDVIRPEDLLRGESPACFV
jgi:hypothetical protein